MVPFVGLLLADEKVHDKNYFLEIALDLGSDRGPSKSDSAESCGQECVTKRQSHDKPGCHWHSHLLSGHLLSFGRRQGRHTQARRNVLAHKQRSILRLVGHAFDVRAQRQPLSKKRNASSSATCIRCATSRPVNSREATHNPDRAVERWCAIEGILLSRSAELDVRRKMCISSSCRFGLSTFSRTSQSAFGIFLKSLIRPTSRSVHEIFLGWAEQALDATKQFQRMMIWAKL